MNHKIADEGPVLDWDLDPRWPDFYGLRMVKVDGQTYAIGTYEQAETAAVDRIREDVWSFNTKFLADWIGRNVGQTLDERAIKALKAMQEKLCEDANPLLLAMLGEQFDDFALAAIDADGMGHFLADYDHEQRYGDDLHPDLAGLLAFRLD